MSYIVIKVYSFECDDCGALYDVTPRPDINILLRDARAELRHAGWSFRDGADLCPKHAVSGRGRRDGVPSLRR